MLNNSSIVSDDIQKVKQGLNSLNRSSPLMTKYEFNQLVGLRTTHIARGSPIFVTLNEDLNIHTNMGLRTIAQKELLEGRLPYIVKRTLPTGKIEYWRVKDMDLSAVRSLFRE
jgi:hypothetical protein